jgi:3-methylfumaryl-CoA hydratase
MTESDKPFADWIGRRSEAEDFVTPRLVASFRAIFEERLARVSEGHAPFGAHWCLAPPIAATSALGGDGHPATNIDLPPAPQPRRMWAGGALELLQPLRLGDRVVRVSTIADVTRKRGRSGELWFVAIDHEYSCERGAAIRERQDLVYRDAARAAAAAAAKEAATPAAAARRRVVRGTIVPSATLLFRYSALTFNGHRIHYDLPYATGIEGYPGLVVHGPLQATLLLNQAAADHGPRLRRFSYRALAPAFAGTPLSICADGEPTAGVYWTESSSGRTHMEARVEGSLRT